MNSILLTGATGLIGSHFHTAYRDRFAIHSVSRRGSVESTARDGHTQLDLSGDWSGDALPRRIDAVIHLAQSENFREFPERASDIFSVNTAATVRLLDYARRAGARAFVLASSGGVYGTSDAAFTENAAIPALGNLGFYLGTRICAEIAAQPYSAYFNLITLRFFFVYGPGQRKTMLIPRLIDNVRSGAPVMLQGEEGIRLNPTFVTDAAEAIFHALSLEGAHQINVAGPEVMSLREVCETIGAAVGRRPVYTIDRSPPGHIVGDISRMKERLQAPRVTFREGLQLVLQSKG